jgi:hypothetical protein
VGEHCQGREYSVLMCNCKRYDPEGERDSGYVCYYCNGRIPVRSVRYENINGKIFYFCSLDCEHLWSSIE